MFLCNLLILLLQQNHDDSEALDEVASAKALHVFSTYFWVHLYTASVDNVYCNLQ